MLSFCSGSDRFLLLQDALSPRSLLRPPSIPRSQLRHVRAALPGLFPAPTTPVRQSRPLSLPPSLPLKASPRASEPVPRTPRARHTSAAKGPLHRPQGGPPRFHPFNPPTRAQGCPSGSCRHAPQASPHLPGPIPPSSPGGPVRTAMLTLPGTTSYSLFSGPQHRRGEAIPSGTAPWGPRGRHSTTTLRALGSRTHAAPRRGRPSRPP